MSAQNNSGAPKPPTPPDFHIEANKGSHVNKVIAVVSGKGGVGKSSVTAMSALWARRNGYQTAILDADIIGPSVPKMFGVGYADLVATEECLYPATTVTGIKVMSMNLLTKQEDAPVIWRSPVITGALKQFWTDVAWGYVDYMFIDMPPGTGGCAAHSIPVPADRRHYRCHHSSGPGQHDRQEGAGHGQTHEGAGTGHR